MMLKIYSEATEDSAHTGKRPMTSQNPLAGEISLDFPKEERLKSVSVSVSGPWYSRRYFAEYCFT